MFPEFIEQVPEHRRIAETLGWQCGIWGSFFLITAWVIVIPGQAHPVEIEWVISATCGALGLFLMGCESWRRRNRTVLVRDGELIAVFRKGRLDLTLSLSEIRSMKAGLVLMIKLSASLGLSTLLFLAIGITSVLREREVSADSVICLGLASALRVFPRMRSLDSVSLRSLAGADQGGMADGGGNGSDLHLAHR
jgi:hypothetical protein